MCDRLCNPSELKFLWKLRGNKNYELISLISHGNFIQYMIFNDRQSKRKVRGKIVTSPGEGEAYHWPRLHHENLAPLVDVVSINETTSVYIFPSTGSSLRNVIHDKDFVSDLDCFDRKKAYAEDILWALDYLHQKSLCIMNLTELIIYICDVADKAVMCDFSCVFLIKRVTKENVQLPALYQAPEMNTEYFQPTAVETWACGVMLLQIFSSHRLPSAFVGNEVHQVLQAIKEINYDIIKEANPRSQLHYSDVEILKSFLDSFLAENPEKRVDVQTAAISSFLRYAKRKSMIKKVSFNKQLTESTYHPSQITSENNNDSLKNATSFKDIYFKEAAKYKNKLKRLPSTNKFINLDFVSNEVDLNNSGKNQCNTNGKASDKKTGITDMVSTDLTTSSNDSSIGDNEGSSPKLCKSVLNNLSMEYVSDTGTSKLEELPNNSGDVMVSTLKNLETHPHTSYLDDEKFCEVLNSSYDNKCVSKKNIDYYDEEHYDPKCTKSPETDITADLPESSVNIEHTDTILTDLTISSDVSSIGDNEGAIPKLCQSMFNNLSMKHVSAIKTSKSEELPNYSEDVIECTLKNLETYPWCSYLDDEKFSDVLNRSSNNKFVTKKNNDKEQYDSKRNMRLETDITTDLLEPSINIEHTDTILTDLTISSDNSSIGDNEGAIPKLRERMFNNLSMKHFSDINTSKSEELPNYSGDVTEGALKNLETYPWCSYLDDKKFSEVLNRSYDNKFGPKKNMDCYDKEQYDTKSNLSPKADISTDLLEPSINIEHADTILTDLTISSDNSSVGDNEGAIPKLCKSMFNNLSTKHVSDFNTSKSEELPNYAGDVIESTLKNLETNPWCSYLDGEKFSEVLDRSYNNKFGPKNMDCYDKEQYDTKCNLSPQTDISTDSLESSISIEMNFLNKPHESDFDSHNNQIFIRSGKDAKENKISFCPKNETDFSKQKTQDILNAMKSESNLKRMGSKSNTNLMFFRSDSCIANISNIKDNNIDSDLSETVFFNAYPNANNSRQIMILDSANLIKTSENDISGYNWQCHGIQNLREDRNFQASQTEASSAYNKCIETQDDKLLYQNSCNLIKKPDFLEDINFYETNKEENSNNLTAIKNIKNSEGTLNINDYDQHEVQNMSYHQRKDCKLGISNGLKYITKPGAEDLTKNEVLKVRKEKRAPLKNLFGKSKLGLVDNNKELNCSSLPFINIEDFSNERKTTLRPHPSTMTIFVPSNLESMATTFLNNTTSKFSKNGKKPKKAKKAWIQYLCPGSNAYKRKK